MPFSAPACETSVRDCGKDRLRFWLLVKIQSYSGGMEGDRSQPRKEKGRPAAFGMYWKAQRRSEVLAATIYMPEFEGPEHEHPEAQVAILLSGSSVTCHRQGVLGSARSSMVPGSFAYLPPEQSHVLQWHGWTEILNLYWERDSLREFADQSGCPLHNDPASYRLDPAIHAIGRMLMDEFLWTGTLSEMMIDHGRALVASRLFRLAEKGSQRWQNGLLPRQRLDNAVATMVANPEKNFTLIDLARLCHASVFYFSRSFTAHLGCAPFAFQRNLRMQRAKDLLLHTELSIEAIGYAVGMESPTSFSRLFRRLIGQSPRKYREGNAENARSPCGSTARDGSV